MAAPTSKSTICKLALDLLQEDNQEPVVDIDNPDTNIETICSRWYDTTRRALLRRKPWNFAIKRASLVASGTTPAFGYTQQYNLPNDFVRLLTIESPTVWTTRYETDYAQEGSAILMDGSAGSTINIRYIYDLTSVVLMDPLFIELLAIELAKDLAYKFTVSNTNVDRLNSLAEQKMSEAVSVMGQESPVVRVERSRALEARYRTSGYYGTSKFDANI